jgi:hypothetical protein
MLACDATLRPLVFQGDKPLDVGRDHRLLTTAQRRALKVRDGGCTFPGCGHTRYVDGHHIDHWIDGGPTDLANLALLCRTHHRQQHRGEFQIRATALHGRFEFVDRRGHPIGPPPDPIPVDPADLASRTGITPTWLTPHAKQCRTVVLPAVVDGLVAAATG